MLPVGMDTDLSCSFQGFCSPLLIAVIIEGKYTQLLKLKKQRPGKWVSVVNSGSFRSLREGSRD